jgi:hypothetical protein
MKTIIIAITQIRIRNFFVGFLAYGKVDLEPNSFTQQNTYVHSWVAIMTSIIAIRHVEIWNFSSGFLASGKVDLAKTQQNFPNKISTAGVGCQDDLN